ncbi:MAG: GDP-L-fucose synthase [Candidatus Omnitrophica bacterium]|nr:GDP-L-fucose synthase [Candidatus Omnitrophota bacterium]
MPHLKTVVHPVVWPQERDLVTGGAGFVGSYVVEKLREKGCRTIVIPRSRDCDLREAADVERLYGQARPTLVIHLAARVGGIGANARHPGKFFYDNAMMGLLVLEYARRSGARKFLGVGTICAYPKLTPVPFRESDLWNGYPEETNAPYGLAKKLLLVQAQAYAAEYGLNAVTVFPTNLYGPGDNFDPETSHVIPALILKCLQAKEANLPQVTLWGSGRPSREFLFVKDAAEAIVLAAERHNDPEPVNIGSGMEIKISGLIRLIARLTDYRGEFVYDTSKPDGQPRRHLDTTRAKERFGFAARTSLEEGLRQTIEWYRAHKMAVGAG